MKAKEELKNTFIRYRPEITKDVFKKIIDRIEQLGFRQYLSYNDYEGFVSNNLVLRDDYAWFVIKPEYMDNKRSEIEVSDILGDGWGDVKWPDICAVLEELKRTGQIKWVATLSEAEAFAESLLKPEETKSNKLKNTIMNKKFFMVFVEGENTPTEHHNSLKKAEKEAQILADKYGKKAFVLESTSMATPDEINVKVDSYEAALDYLGRKNNASMYNIHDKHAKAMVAMYKLITIAEAWNKADNFVPDFSNHNQCNYIPWFVYNDKAAGFVCAYTAYTASRATAYFGSRLCFKTNGRAEQFGKQFIDLWNDFLLFR